MTDAAGAPGANEPEASAGEPADLLPRTSRHRFAKAIVGLMVAASRASSYTSGEV